MDITWLGHSCFRIKSNQAVIITDPVGPDTGYTLGKQTANLVTVSHSHPGHSYADSIEGNPRIVKSPGEYEISNIIVIGIATYHDSVKGQTRGKNNVYVMEVDGVSVCHLGDIGHVPTDEQVEEMGNVDVLMIPVGGGSTINAAMATEVLRKIEPKIVIPMHYKTEKSTRDLDTIDAFIKETGFSQLEPRAKASITRNNLPASLQVYLFSV